MFFRISLIVLLFAAQLGTTLTQAYASSYSDDDNTPTTSTTITTTAGLGHITLPQVIQKQQQEQQQHQHQKQKLPLVTYITTSTTSTGGIKTNPNQKYRAPPVSLSGIGGGGVFLQPAFVYDAAVPQQQDEQDEQKLKNEVGNITKSKVDIAKHSDDDATNDDDDDDDEASKKIIGSSVVTSVSVILDGDQPTFTDALGHKVPKPQPSLQVASPIDLLNPDRYEFYTFDENGELVKRLMTMQEIQSIVANGDGEGPSIIHTALQEDINPEKNVQDIVDSVQSVLNKEVASSKNATADVLPVLDTPDVSSSWSLILPAIFGNTGGDIFPQQKPPQIAMTPDTELVETSTKAATPTRATKKPKPAKRKPGQKRKPTTTTTTEIAPQVVQEELDPMESVYTGMQQFQNLAASMQNFNSFSDFHMQPIYEKLPSTTAKPPSTTTRRVFVNNQELVQSTSASFDPVASSSSSITTEQILLNANLAKKPANVPLKRIPPHRIKKPNVSTTKHPLGTSTNKQKIKKKTSSTTTTTTTTTPAPTQEPTTPETTTTTTTTTTTIIPPTQPPTPITTTTTQSPISTTQKKKKRKPTRQPGHNATSTNGKPTKPKRKPSAKPSTTSQHQSSDLDPAASAHHDATHPHQQIISNVHKPRPQRPHNRPAHLGNGHRKSSTTTTSSPIVTTTEPVTTTTPEPTTTSTTTTEPTTTSTTTTTTTEATTTTTTTTTTEPTTTSTTTTTTPIPITTTSTTTPVTTPIFIGPHHPGHHQVHRKPPLQHLHDRPIYHKNPLHNYKPHYDDDNVSTTSSIESYDLLSSLPPKLPSSTVNNLNSKQPTSTIAITTANKPDNEDSPAYLVPIFDKNQKLPTSSDDFKISIFKKTPLPSLAMIQQQLQQQSSPAPSSQLAPDMNTILSMDQIVQSLTQDQSNKVNDKDNAAVKEDTQTNAYQPVKPVKYETAVTTTQIASMVEKKKVAITTGGAPITSLPVTAGSTTIVTTIKPLIANYGGSTLATTLADIMTHPSDQSTSTESSEQDTTLSEDSEQNTPFVVITARPQYFAGTTTPETLTTLMEEQKTEQTNIETTEELSVINIPTSTQNPTLEGAQVVKFEPLFADIQEPIITTFTESNTEIIDSTQTTESPEDTTTTTIDISDKLDTQNSNGESETTESESASDETTNNIQLRLPVMRPSSIDSLSITTEENTETPPQIADLIPQLNLDVLHPKDEILMSNFQTQAATVASTLVDGTNTLLGDGFMSSNETKTEIEFLMSDVIQQMTNPESKPVQEYKPMEENSNRLTNFAQFNSSFLNKPTVMKQQESSDTETESSIENETTELVEPDEIPLSTYIPKLENTTPSAYEEFDATTNVPSIEQFIKKEDFDSLTQKYEEIAQIPLETSTNKIPILSLSHIYAQEQQDENDMLELLQLQKDKIVDTIVHHQEDVKEPIIETHTVSKFDETDIINTDKAVESSTEQVPIGTDLNKSAEDSSNSQMEQSLEQANTENVTINEKLDSIKEDNKRHDEEDEMPQMLTNNYNEQSAHETNESATDINSDLETSTEEHVSTESNLQMDQISLVNKSSDDKLPSQNMSTTLETKVPIKVESIEKSEEQSVDKTETIEDNATNAASLQAVYVSEPSSQEYTSIVEKESPEKSQTTDQTNKPSSNATLTEQITKIPGDMTIVSSEADVTLNSEQVTQKTEQQKDTEEEITEELTAEIDEQNTSEEKTKEDDYIKLGETIASIVKASLEEDVSSSLTPSTETSGSVEQTPPQPISLEHQNESNTNVEPVEPVAFISSTTSKIEEDEEDDLDQTGYQVPVHPVVSLDTSTQAVSTTTTTTRSTTTTTEEPTTTPQPTTTSTTKRLNTLKPVSYYVQPSLLAGYNQAAPAKVPINNSYSTLSKITPIYHQSAPPKVTTYSSIPSTLQQRPMQRPAALTNLMASSTQATRPPVKIEPSPDSSKGLEASVAHLDEDMLAFSSLCNELAFSYWKSITSERISSARSLVISPFALTSMLSMVFLGARGSTSGEMNEILKLDDMVTFNPHLVFKNITDSVEHAIDSDIATTAFVREIFSDRANGKILQFFKEKTQQLYAGHVEEVNFHVVNDIIRRRTNLLVKRHSMGKVMEYLRTNSVWVNGPLATISANLFQTDCSHGSTQDRDGEMFFQVHPTVRQRRLVPIPAVLYRSGFTAGYEPKLDATVVAFGRIQDTVSTIYLMPGHQSSIYPADNLDRLEHDLVELAFSENAWKNILTSLMDRPGMEVQLPRFSHRSFVNATLGLQKMGLKGLFKSDFADLRGLTGAANHDIFLSDMIQINTFSTCGEEKISDHHHVEMYPAPPLRKRNKDVDATDDDAFDSSEAIIDFGSLVQESALGRGFYDDLLDPKYLELPLPLRPRQARVPDAPRLRFDKPFLYFVRHNPTGMILYMGRFNPRLLP